MDLEVRIKENIEKNKMFEDILFLYDPFSNSVKTCISMIK